MKIAIGSDHAGFEYKELIKEHLKAKGHNVTDFGTDSNQSCDYPDFIHPVAESVAAESHECGIVLGGSGNGEAIAANKTRGIRCAVCWDIDTARLAKEHNNANIISIGQRTICKEMALEIVDTWLASDFEGGRHLNRINKIEK